MIQNFSSYEIEKNVIKHVVIKTAYQSLMSMYISHCTIVLLNIDQKGFRNGNFRNHFSTRYVIYVNAIESTLFESENSNKDTIVG